MHPNLFIASNPHLSAPRTDRQNPRKPGALRLWLRAAFRKFQRRKMIEALQGMDNRLLRDIGIERSEIPRLVDGLIEREPAMRSVSAVRHPDATGRGNRAA
ncbi:DUF1127 domain-containing protein [Ponticoccus sp. (in: a-proteobacteria)]|uniref:DUF1127 domain-containing protein n=1 Tax=Ponticoccus sp. (in: a-proteobacteria) TaxID=1925025 RepID=UPI003AB65436